VYVTQTERAFRVLNRHNLAKGALMTNLVVVLLLFLFLQGFACQNSGEPPPQAVSQAFFAAGPKLVKIAVKDTALVDSLISQGVDVIVIADDHVIARLDGQSAARVQTMALSMKSIKEQELVQRLIRVVMRQQSDLSELASTGIDIWEVRGDTVIAQAYDKYIRQIQSKGYSVEIIAKNVLDR
jgi:hypothetical protein